MVEELLASVIVPVYNKEKYLKQCFDSLSHQSIDHDMVEAIFVDDGSSDGSLRILRELEKENSWVTVVSQENSGVCAARNAGINAAKGRYLFFLDPDDFMSPGVLSQVSTFFDEHYDEIDLVTYPIVPIVEGEEKRLHYRYGIMTEDGVYDLRSDRGCLICQTTMNVCVKNEFERNQLFEFVSFNGKIFHEDQAYITDILLKKMKIGFCAEPRYFWRKNEDSVSSVSVNSYSLFENTVNMYEELFARFEGDVPLYVQSLLVNDIGWKMRQDALLPTHLTDEAERSVAMQRLVSLIDRVDDDLILRHPNIHKYHAYYFIGLKSGPSIEALTGLDSLALMRKGRTIYAGSHVEAILLRTRFANKGLEVFGFLKSPVFLYYDERVELVIELNYGSKVFNRPVPLVESSWSRCGCKTVTAKFYDFCFVLDPSDLRTDVDVRLLVMLDGLPVGCYFSCFPKTNFSKQIGNVMITDEGSFSLVDGARVLRYCSHDAAGFKAGLRQVESHLPSDVKALRRLARGVLEWKRKSKRQVWVYTDSPGKIDNAWLQYEHDSKKDDGILRVYAENGSSIRHSIKFNEKAIVVSFRSRVHKLLFIVADKVICSDIAFNCYSALGPKARHYYSDMFNAEMIYLQHGVLWAHMPWYYSADRTLFDKVVVSTVFEVQNLMNNYGYKDSQLVKSGMPRYSLMKSGSHPGRKILVCPSWRAYLIGALTSRGRVPMTDKFKDSQYYKGFSGLFRSKELADLLERFDYELHFKLHPIFGCYSDLFSFCSDRMSMVDKVEESDYSIVVTDFSSYSFDFVYLKRALIYFIPDREALSCGLNHYGDLDMPIDDAFGPCVYSFGEAIEAIEQILMNGGAASEAYRAKMDGLFLFEDSAQSDRLYEAMMDA